MLKLTCLLFLTIIFGCHNEKQTVLPDPASTMLNVATQPTWKTEPFNEDYTIQFPAGYEGNGMVGFEGPTFGKNRADKQVLFRYFFCSPSFCSSYGEAIPVPYPPTIMVDKEALDQIIEIRNNEQIQTVFYFTKKSQTQGLLYLKDPYGGSLRQSVQVSYPYNSLAEVLGILQTIRPK